MSEQHGLDAVDKDRWQRAQQWELEFWQRAQQKTGWKKVAFKVARPFLAAIQSRRATGDDWNHWWREQFDDYSFLPENMGQYIELGCGPYTNTRLVLRDHTADRVVCSDPLADEYLKFKGRWLSDAHRKGDIEVDNHPIEELPYEPGTFDVVVIINVLDHVMDADACMKTAIGLLKPGGIIVFGQNLANPEMRGKHEWFEEGHPIRATAEDVEGYLQGLEPVLNKTVPPNDPPLHTGMLVYAGRRPAAA
jgi:SAM-dependent methyltransferase